MPNEEEDPAAPPRGDDTATRTVQAEGESPVPERRIGPYRLLRELGHGGMGTVYLAARADEQFQKRVALKVIRAGADSAEVVRHFKRERQILASLDHPNIARLLDGGATDDGLPYLVMEYIEGEPIPVYCDSRNLSIADRLKLFQSVCSAVQYAHRNLVVHRDIKPGNVLVGQDGSPRLLDFGIAKLLNPELAGEAPTATAMVMTPAYASPEQVRGDHITTATDVYSLGVLLYELLTGRHPYRLAGGQPLDVLKAISEQEPERPSTALDRTEVQTLARTGEGTPERLKRRLQGDLDNILMTALRKEPQRRYASVEAFSDDIRRYLEGLPVKARTPTLGYRAGKFVKRHVVGVAASVAALALLVAFAVAMAVQSARVARERDAAERERATAQRERETAQRVSAFLVDLFKVSDPSEARGNTITAREVLDKGAAKIATELKDQPEVRATLMHTMGRVYSSLGLYDKALPMLREALETRKAALGPEHPSVAESLSELGNVLRLQGDYAGAEASHREALALRRRLFGDTHLSVAASLNNLANVLAEKGDYAGAEPLYREALAMRRRLLGDEDPDVAASLSNLASLLFLKGDYAGAEPLHREALAMRRRLLGAKDPNVAVSLNNLANVLGETGDYTGAEALLREAIALRRDLLGAEHPQVAESVGNLAETLYRKGDYRQAETFYRESLGLLRKGLGSDNPMVAFGLVGLAATLSREQRPREAEPLAREAVAILKKALPPDHPDLAAAESVLGECLTLTRAYEEAETLLLGSYAVLKGQAAGGRRPANETLQRLVRLYEAWGKPDKAAQYRAELR